ncbi:Serine/threonine-protein kinase PknB [Nocardia farcinica]|uniref:serine/threonine-protein kinase n=1 Tax=Nocardia farcinica TaxID=37329 RepID=UPI000BF3B877|nr:serine/threonine-protein kinase [Nocardia farcinica]PFX03379.1 Serine/threonine-protein kinase PknB [Nocardia farcinica]
MTADRLIAGRYRLAERIGTGAMGVVWRATDERLQRVVAVKQLLLAPGLTREQAQDAKQRAMREGRIAARLHHPHAITVFDVAEEDGQPWLVMEYMPAPSLAAEIAGGRTLPPHQVADIGAQAAAALAAAHAAGIMHRDVKPANLLVGNGTVKITDFGISRAVGDVTVTATGFLAGTPAYLAPEVARGEDPSPASDVFALGATLYAAVEGAPPFGEGDNPLAVLHAVARGEIPPPRRAGPLAPVLMRLLAADPVARPSMPEAARALADVAAGRTPALAAAPAATRVMPTPGADSTAVFGSGSAEAGGARRPTLLLVAIAAVAVLALAGLLLATRDRDGADDTAAPPVATPSAAPNPAPGGGAPQPEPPAPSTTTTTTATTTTTTAPTTTTTPPPADAASFARTYYGMLPGDIAGAWSQLTPAYQAQTGGFGAYSRFWSSIRSVRVDAVTPTGPDTATVALTYTTADGTVTSENRWIRVSTDDGRTRIAGSGL